MTRLNELLTQGDIIPRGANARGCREFVRQGEGHAILVPAGPFIMGSTTEAAQAVELAAPWYRATIVECPMGKPKLAAFLIDRHEVTAGAYARFLQAVSAGPFADDKLGGAVGARLPDGVIAAYDSEDYMKRRPITGSQHTAGVVWTGNRWEPVTGAEECPIVLVTWFGAAAYASWVGWELPTEAQWEKAARGTDGRAFPWGDTYDPELANTADRWLGQRIPDQKAWDTLFYREGHGKAWLRSRPLRVGSIPAGTSFYGCDDMVGNVAEWCGNWYQEDAYARFMTTGADFTQDLPPSGYRSMRGAGRYGYEAISRCACRRRRDPASVSENLGFRCSLSVDVPAEDVP